MERMVEVLAILVVLSALIGLTPAECNDSNCRSVHRQHKAREAEQKALSLHRAQHNSWNDPVCRHCRERKDAGYK